MTETGTKPAELTLLGGELCLDFANTAEWHASNDPLEHLYSYGDLLAWAEHAEIVDSEMAGRLLGRAAEHPEEAQRVYEAAIQLREAIYGIFTAISHGEEPSQIGLDRLNADLARWLPHTRIVDLDGRYIWQWAGLDDELECPLWPVIRSAVGLLTSGQLERVGQCADERGCGWLFLDTSRNRSRRWCSMDDCGNRAKAKRYYKRHQEGT
jgi:predicted RNA-binding Zn ribbon-like protein